MNSSGAQDESSSNSSSVSEDGHFVAFQSYAGDLVPGDVNGFSDVFIREVSTNTTTLASVGVAESQGSKSSFSPTISADGQFIAFSSSAINLLPEKSNGTQHIFLRDLLGGTSQVSLNQAGVQVNLGSSSPSISANGRFITFSSYANNLVPGDMNKSEDVFVRDVVAGTTMIVSVDSAGLQGISDSSNPSISADGRFVVFSSYASNLVPGDANNTSDVFVRDLAMGTTIMVSKDSTGAQSNSFSAYPAISADGRLVAFCSSANNLVSGDINGHGDIFLRDLEKGSTSLISVSQSGSQGNNYSIFPCISADGAFVAYESLASNLVDGDTNNNRDIFVRNLNTGTTVRVSASSSGGQANEDSSDCSISADGRFVTFVSDGDNLVQGDTNDNTDIFVRDLETGLTSRVSVDSVGTQANRTSAYPSISADGRFVTFSSFATNLTLVGKRGDVVDIFRHERTGFSTISGNIDLDGFIGRRGLPIVQFELAPVGGGPSVRIPVVALDSKGNFRASTSARGAFTLSVKASTFLRRKLMSPIIITGNHVEHLQFRLTNGDCNGDNYVGNDDYFILNRAFDTSTGEANFDPRADLNGDGYVGSDDYLILNQNFDKEGD